MVEIVTSPGSKTRMASLMAGSYGAMTTLFSFFEQAWQVKMQQLSRWWYRSGVARIQTKIDFLPYEVFSESILFLDSADWREPHFHVVSTKSGASRKVSVSESFKS